MWGLIWTSMCSHYVACLHEEPDLDWSKLHEEPDLDWCMFRVAHNCTVILFLFKHVFNVSVA